MNKNTMKRFSFRTCIAIGAFLALSLSALAQTNPPLWSPTTSYKTGDLVTYQSNTFQCLLNETTNHPNPHQLGWDVNFLYTGNFTIHVGPSEEFKTLSAAWIYIKFARIAVGSTITISLDSNYTENFASSFSLDHPYGAQISIVGYAPTSTANFPANSAGFVLDSGHAFGQLSGLAIVGPNHSSFNPAILVEDKAVLLSLVEVSISGFDVGIEAENGDIASVLASTVSSFTDAAIISTGSLASIYFPNSIVIDGSHSSKVPPYAFEALQGGNILCAYGCQANNCGVGFYAAMNGTIICNFSSAGSTPAAAGYAGYYSTTHGSIFAEGATTSGFQYGYLADHLGSIDAQSSEAKAYALFGYDTTIGATIDATGTLGGSTSADTTSHILK